MRRSKKEDYFTVDEIIFKKLWKKIEKVGKSLEKQIDKAIIQKKKEIVQQFLPETLRLAKTVGVDSEKVVTEALESSVENAFHRDGMSPYF